ncbi:hypothetical protein GQ600_20283 [Phytophthora cactorum]|nr:hypothetical protein GQ600_20283 [Phytophthora cactorum]
MRLYSIVLPAILSCVDNASANTTPKTFTNSFLAVVDHQNAVPSQRHLRTYATTDKNAEERGGIENIVSALMPFKDKVNLKAFLRAKNNGVDVLNSLQLGDDVVSALTHANLKKLDKYIAMFNKNNADEPISLVGILTLRYGDDAVAKSLAYLEKHAESPQVEKLATQLRSDQLTAWMKDGKTVDEVFNLLKLGDDGAEALANRKFTVLQDYIAKYNTEKNGHVTLLQTFTKGFDGESNLVTVLAAAKRDQRIAPLARKLEKELLGQWRQETLEPEKVMKLLRLDNDVDDALKSENLRTFEKYIAEFNENSANSQVSLLEVLTSKFGEVGVAKAIVSAKANENSAWVAIRLQKQQLQGWLDNGMTVDHVFTSLKFLEDKTKTAIFGRSLDTLGEYIALYNTVRSKHETLIGVLEKGFGGKDKLVAMLMQARLYPETNRKATALLTKQFQQWQGAGVVPTTILSKVFEVADDKATDFQKTVASQFEKFTRASKPLQ